MSNETKWTPGPWAPHATGKARSGKPEYEIHWSDNGECIAEIVHGQSEAHLIAAAPDLYEAIVTAHECGQPDKVSLYDEDGIEGWRWTHADGREWDEVGSWDESPPMHPDLKAAIEKAKGQS